MGLQEDAARALDKALRSYGFQTVIRHGRTPVVEIKEHPTALVHFRLQRVDFVFDGQPAVRQPYWLTDAGAEELAKCIVERIAGNGGGGSAAI